MGVHRNNNDRGRLSPLADWSVKVEPNKVIMTAREETPKTVDVVLKTPSGEANVQVVTMSVWRQVAIRSLRAYVQNLLGFILAVGTGAAAASGVGLNMPAANFGNLLLASAGLALGPTVICMLQNTLEILTKLDVTNPEIRA